MNTKKTGNIIAYFIEKLGQLDHYKIGKLLYFLDSRFYMIYGRTVTELEYAKLPYGPAPDNYDRKYAELEEHGYIKLDFKKVNSLNYFNIVHSDLEILEEIEKEVLDQVIDQYGNKSFDELMNITHSEKPYNLPKYPIGSLFDFEDILDTEEDFINALKGANDISSRVFHSGEELVKHLGF